MPENRQTRTRESAPEGPAGPDWDAFWDAAGREPPASAPPFPDLSALMALIEAVRTVVPRELQDQFNSLVRELLLTLRALIDWYLERLDGGRAKPQVEEIPIE